MEDIYTKIIVTVVSSLILAVITPYLKKHIELILTFAWSTIRLLVFFTLLTTLLVFNSEAFDDTETMALGLLFIALTVVELLNQWKFGNATSVAAIFTRIAFSISLVALFLYMTATRFDETEMVTLGQMLILISIFEFIRPKKKVVIEDDYKYVINGPVPKRKLSHLLSKSALETANASRLVDRSFIHICTYKESVLVGFVNLMWINSGPGEIDLMVLSEGLPVKVGLKAIALVETEANQLGINEIQISPKVVEAYPDVIEKLKINYEEVPALRRTISVLN